MDEIDVLIAFEPIYPYDYESADELIRAEQALIDFEMGDCHEFNDDCPSDEEEEEDDDNLHG